MPTDDKLRQYSKVLIRVVTFSEIDTEVNLLQPEKAYGPMSVTLSGIIIDARLLH